MENQAQNQTQQPKYFDLHTSGLGYLSRIREVTPRRGEPFMACTIGALRGDKDKPEYTYIDCRVYAEEAKQLVCQCQAAVSAGKKVLVGFKIGDIYAETFIYESEKRKGETGVSIKGRLIHLSWIKIDGEMVHQYKKAEASGKTETQTEVQTEQV